MENLERNIINGENSIDVISEAKKLSEEGSQLFGKNRELLNAFERMQGQPFENLQPYLEKKIKDNKASIELLSSSQQLLSNALLRQKLLEDIKETDSIYNKFLSTPTVIKFVNLSMIFSAILPIIASIGPFINAYSENQLQNATDQFRSYSSQVEQYESQVEQYESQLKVLNQLSQSIAALKAYQNHLAEALNEHKASTERFKQLDEFIFNKLKETIGTEENLSKIDKNLESSKKVADVLNKEYTSQKQSKDELEKKIYALEKDISANSQVIAKIRRKFDADQRTSNSHKELIESQIRDKSKQLKEMKRDSEKNSKELKTLESEVKTARRQMYAARRQVKQAQMEFGNITRSFDNDSDQVDASQKLLKNKRDELAKQMGYLLGGNLLLSSDDRLGPSNTKAYDQKWAYFESITPPQTGKGLNLQDDEYVKASQTILARLASVPKDHSQRIFWMRYGEIIGRTIKTYKDPQPEGAQEQLTTAFDKLNQANKIANEFLDLMYGKEQKASSSQGQAWPCHLCKR